MEHLSDSRLEVDLVRSLGGAAAAVTLDFDKDDDEPRTILIRGFGPRWLHAPVLPTQGPAPKPTERNS